MRSLGLYYWKNNHVEKSIESQKLALNINPMFQQTWFLLGCSQMKLQRFKDAIKSFSNVVKIDPSCAEAWGNLAALNVELNNLQVAMSCIIEATKYKRQDWRLWDNRLKISTKLGLLQEICESIRNINQIGKQHIISDHLIDYLSTFHLDKQTKLIKTCLIELSHQCIFRSSIWSTLAILSEKQNNLSEATHYRMKEVRSYRGVFHQHLSNDNDKLIYTKKRFSELYIYMNKDMKNNEIYSRVLQLIQEIVSEISIIDVEYHTQLISLIGN